MAKRATPQRRQIDIFSAGCATCNETIEMVTRFAAVEGHEVRIHDMHQDHVAQRARELGVRSIPAVAVVAPDQQAPHGQFAPLNATKLAACCANRGVDEARVREALAAQ
jgi:thioredoxin-like negative regulator of GroEL